MSAYYNENDPKAAAWLRELIKGGHIAQGDVDERSIEDVAPVDLDGYTQCHFFAGIGGWSYALRLAGWPDNKAVWTGSCPCQPFSTAGKGKGFADERHLWPAWFHLIRTCRPARIFGEQVASAVQWIDLVQDDLEAEAYRVGYAVLGAHSVGAPHIRQRLYWVGDASGAGTGGYAGTTLSAQTSSSSCWRQDGGHSGDHAEPSGTANGLGYADEPRSQGRRNAGSGRTYQGSPWTASDFIECRDGKRRPVEPGIQPLAHGFSESLDQLRAIEMVGREKVIKYASEDNSNPGQVLRTMRQNIQSKEDWKRTIVGVCQQLHAPEILLTYLQCVEAACDGAADESRIKETRREACRRIVRGMWLQPQFSCTPRERRPDEQPARQFADPVFALSLVLARHAQAYAAVADRAHATSGRVGLLRGYGNAIVAPLAAKFIEACMT